MNTALKPRRIRKLWHKGLASLPLITGKRRRGREYEIEDIPVGQNRQFDVTPDKEDQLARIFADPSLARRVLKLQREKYEGGTMPELVVYEFLERKGVPFKYQVALLGGHAGGGLVPDFVITRDGSAHVLLIQGIYWHNIPGKREKDQGDKLRLMNTFFDGDLIDQVTFVWENRIMCPNPQRERTLEDALQGIETGQ